MAGAMPNLSEEQKNRLAQRLSMMSHDRADVGQGLPRTSAALAMGEGADAGAARLEALVDALVFERVIVPIDVEPDPRATGVHAGENGHNPIDFVRAQTPAGEALAIYSSAQALSAHRPGDRPMALDFRTIGLTALVETGGSTPGPTRCCCRVPPSLRSRKETSGCLPGAMKPCACSCFPSCPRPATPSSMLRLPTRATASRACLCPWTARLSPRGPMLRR